MCPLTEALFLYLHRGVGIRIMPNFSDLVPFHSGQVRDFYCLVQVHELMPYVHVNNGMSS